MNGQLELAELKRLLKAWRDADESIGPREEASIAEALAAWGLGKGELDGDVVYDGIDFMASYFYRKGGAFSAIRVFLERAAAARLSVPVECSSRGYLLTLYGEISEVPRLSRIILDEDASDSIMCVSALKKAILLRIPRIREALEPLLANSTLDPEDRADLQRLIASQDSESVS